MNGTEGFKSLIYAVRWTALGHLASRLAIILALLCLPSVLAAIIFSEYQYIPWLISVIALLLVFAALTWRLPEPHRVFVSEGFVLTSVTFLMIPVLMSIALWPASMSFDDLILETTSAITTTGLSTVAQPELADRTLLFTRSWMQWYGGLGIVVFSVTFLMQRSLAVYQLLDIPEGQGIVSAASVYARKVLKLYLVISLLVIAICWAALGDFYDGLLHGFAAISTGGFSTLGTSMESLPFIAQLGVMLCGLAGALSFAIYLQLSRGAWHQVLDNQELKFFIGLTLLVCGLLTLVNWGNGADLMEAARNAVLMGTSAISTTGFSSMETSQMSNDYMLILIAAMFLGGCLGSTAGGFKIFRVMVVVQVLVTYFRRASAAPHGVIEPRIQGRLLTQDQEQLAMLAGTLFVALTLISWFMFLMYDYDAVDSLYEVVSAVATVGLSSGITNTELPLILKGVLCVDMIAGRVEVLALLYLFYPGAWFGHRNHEH